MAQSKVTLENEVPSDFPIELADSLQEFHTSLVNVENVLEPLLKSNFNDVKSKLNSLDRARLDLGLTYTLNSLFWIYLKTRGENPKDTAVKQELDRIKDYMTRAKEIADREKAPRLNTAATKRFVRSSLWEPQNEDQQRPESTEEAVNSEETKRSPKKRRHK